MRKKLMLLPFLSILVAGLPVCAAVNPISIDLGGNLFILPLQKVNAIQLYSFEDGKGYPGVETTVYSRAKFRVGLGAAAVLGTSTNVPFASATFKLTPVFFDTSNNDIYFGAWVGKPSNGDGSTWGVSATVNLW